MKNMWTLKVFLDTILPIFWQRRSILLNFIISFTLFTTIHAQQLVINEVSNGTTGSQEFVELVVTGTCGQTLDIRGYYLDDNCSLSANVGRAEGAARFTQHAQWAAVPAGSIIVIYNGTDRNIALPADDPTDTNCDGIYIIPITASTPPTPNLYIETQSTPLGGCAASNYTTSSGYGTNNNWATIALGNTADLMQIRDASGNAIMSVGYGTGIATPGGTFISFAGAGGNMTFQANGSTPLVQAGWSNLAASSQSPGYPNTCANAAWIEGMRGIIETQISPAPICANTSGGAVNLTTCNSAVIDLSPFCNVDMYSWTSASTAVATVNPSGMVGTITAVDNGTTTVTLSLTKTHSVLYTVVAGCSATPQTFTVTYPVTVTGCSVVACPSFTGITPNNVTISSNSTCDASCMLTGGVIMAAVNNCPTGSTLEYSSDGGTTWSTVVPVYDQDGPAQSIITKCNCDTDNTMNSGNSAPEVTIPGICIDPCICSPNVGTFPK